LQSIAIHDNSNDIKNFLSMKIPFNVQKKRSDKMKEGFGVQHKKQKSFVSEGSYSKRSIFTNDTSKVGTIVPIMHSGKNFTSTITDKKRNLPEITPKHIAMFASCENQSNKNKFTSNKYDTPEHAGIDPFMPNTGPTTIYMETQEDDQCFQVLLSFLTKLPEEK